MTLFESVRNRISPETLVMVAAIVVAPVFGVAIAAATRGQFLYFLIIGGVLGVFVTLYAPIQLLVLGGLLGAMLADSRFDNTFVYYGRFVPMGMLTIRTLFDMAMRRERMTRVERVYLIPGLIFVAVALFSAVYSLTPDLTLQRSLSMAFVIIICGVGLPNYLVGSGSERLLKLVILLIGGVVLFGTVFAQGGGDSAVYIDGSFLRVRGFFANPNTQGLMAMLILFPILWWQQTARPGIGKNLLSLTTLAWAGLVLLTGSRSSFLGMLAGGIVLLWLYGRKSLHYAPLLGLAAGLLLLLALALPEFGRSFDVFGSPSTNEATVGLLPQVDRPFLIQRAIELGMRSPIVGIGFGASDLVFEQDHLVLVQQGIFISGSHNSYTRMFVDLGILGILVGFPIFILILTSVFLAPAAVRHDPMVALMTATVVAGLVNAFFEDWLFGFGSASTLPLWLFLALIPIRMSQLQEPDRVEPLPPLYVDAEAVR